MAEPILSLRADTASVPNQGPVFIWTSSIMTVVAGVLVSYRLSSTYKRRGSIAVAEIMVAIALGLDIVSTVLGCQATNYGFGRHKKDIAISGGNISKCLLYFWAFQIVYKMVLCFNKMSFLFMYLTIFEQRTFRLVNIGTIAVAATGTFAMIMATVFQCTPVEKTWNKKLPGHCINNGDFRWSFAIFNTVMDIWVCLLPTPIIIRLQMSLAKRIGVILIFALGIFVCVTSIIRMVALTESISTKDATWGSFMTLVWSSVEANTGIICACLPSLKYGLTQCFPHLMSTRRSKPGHSNSYGMGRLGSRTNTKKSNPLRSLPGWRNDGGDHVTTVDGGMHSFSQKSSKGWESPRESQEQIIRDGGITMTTDISLKSEGGSLEEVKEIRKGGYY